MASIAFTIPREEGTGDHSKELVQALTEGEIGKSVHDRRRAHGFDRIKVWQQESPRLTIVYLEAADLDAAIQALAADEHEHNRWVLEKIEKITGRNPKDHEGRPSTRLLVDWHAEKGHSATHH